MIYILYILLGYLGIMTLLWMMLCFLSYGFARHWGPYNIHPIRVWWIVVTIPLKLLSDPIRK